ncbi:hypothetical protein NLM26_19790, partial [Streptomyces drozdowiczii]|nr:hypothetical protein [Streptomyces drozdowiczii]
MGIESDQLVYDYLSRVGDLAQQQQLPSGARMRLVAELRTEIDRRREAQRAHTPGQVRRIIGTLGTPDELVAAAALTGAPEPPDPPEIPEPRRASLPDGERPSAPRRAGKGAFSRRRADRDADSPEAPVPPQADPDASAPHRLGMGELGADAAADDWWQDEPGPFAETGPGAFGEFGPGTEVPGFRGGVEIPALLRPPEAEEEPEAEVPEEEPEAPAPPPEKTRRLRRARPAPA